MIDKNDPRLTQYVLGELDDRDALAIENAIANSPELQSVVEEIREVTVALENEFQSELLPGLLSEQVSEVQVIANGGLKSVDIEPNPVVASPPKKQPKRFGSRSVRIYLGLASALSILFVANAYFIQDIWQWNASNDRLAKSENQELDDAFQVLMEEQNAAQEIRGHSLIPDIDVDGPLARGQQSISNLSVSMNGYVDLISPINTGLGNNAKVFEEEVGLATNSFGFHDRRTEATPQFDSGAHEFGADSIGAGASSSDEPLPAKPIGRVEIVTIPGNDIIILKGDPKDVARFEDLIAEIEATEDGAVKANESRFIQDNFLKNTGTGGDVDEAIKRLITTLNSKNKSIQEKAPSTARSTAEAEQLAKETEQDAKNKTKGEKPEPFARKKDDKAEPKKNKSWKRVEAIPNTSRLMVGDKDELEMQGVQANIKIDGFRARVLLDCFYYNNRDKQLEGNFKIRLPDDSSLFYFAFGESVYSYSPEKLDLTKNEFDKPNPAQFASFQPNQIADHRKDDWKNVKEARCVEKQKAAFAYSQTVKRRVDPALVEWAGAGVFNAKVFPLAPKKMHRIVIGYDVDLKKVAADWQFQFAVPKTNRQTQINIDVKRIDGVEVTSSIDQKPTVTDDSIHYHFRNPTDAFQINLRDSQPVWLVNETNDIFATKVVPKFGDENPDSTSQTVPATMPVQPKRAVFLLDTSLSSDPDKFNVWLKLLKKVLNQNRDQIDGFAVLNFNIESFWWKNEFMPNTKANVASLLTDCNRLVLEGATDLHAVMSKLNSTQWVSQSDLPVDCFLLSDGAATWGETQLAKIQYQFQASTKPKRLIAYQTGYTGTAIRSLRSLAQNSGGAVFSIANESELVGVAKAHRIQPWKLDSIEIDGAREILTAGRVQWIYPGQPITIVGKSLAKKGQGSEQAFSGNVVLNVSRNSQLKKIRIPISQSIQSDLAERTYGQVAVGQLESLGQLEKELSIAYARNFRITGQNCSLLMLESEADYKRFEINQTDDQMVIKTSLVDKVIAARIDEFEKSVKSPKLAVQNWLKRLENAPGQKFKIPTALSHLVTNLEDLHFVVSQSEVNCENRFSAEKAATPNRTAKKKPMPLGDFFSERLPAKVDSDALRELSSFIENKPGDMQLAKAIAQGAIDMKSPSHAFFILRRVADMRPFDSDIYMLLGRCLSELDQYGYAIVCYEIAMNSTFTNRKSDFKKIVAYDYARVLRNAISAETEDQIKQYATLKLKRIDKEFEISEQDLVIRLSWNTDGSDVDLHVTEPNGDVCFYEHPKTVSGGKLTADITDGFGPELYRIDKAPAGKYKIQVKYYSQNGNRTSSASQATIEVIENYGRKNETSFRKTVSLSGRELIDVATIAVEK